MSKPRAARRKPVVLSSDSEDTPPSPPSKRPRRGITTNVSSATRALSPNSVLPSSQGVPEKLPGKLRPVYKPITSFFSNATETKPSPSPEKALTPLDVVDDILDSSDDDLRQFSLATLPVRADLRPKPTAIADSATKSRQKFLHTAGSARGTPPPSQLTVQDGDSRPWTEKYGPMSLDELAVHKKKITDVKIWLSNVFCGKERKRLLLLKGPAGSGKTTTVSLITKELGIDVQEWKNPVSSTSVAEGFLSVTAQFEEFVSRTHSFGSLTFEGSSRPSMSPVSSTSRPKQLVLVEEFPNTFSRTSSGVQSFRSAVLNFLAASTLSASAFFSSKNPAEAPITPIVMIISETLLSTSTAAADCFTAHRLLGSDILTHPGVSVIDFNPIAATYMSKALELIVVKEARKSGRKKTVGPQVIQRLAALGDIRSAVSSLEFLCIRGDNNDGWGAKIAFTKKKALKNTPLTRMEQESLEMVTQRESTLGIFHAVGRVVYNKRSLEDPSQLVPQPPHWFPERRRNKPSEVDVDALIDELGTDTQTFIAALHENYVLSCGGADSEETLESIEGCIETLSDANLLSPDRFAASSGRRNLQGTSADNLRQDEMCFQMGVRGLIYNLPNPVKRVVPPPGVMGARTKGQGAVGGAAKGSAFVMYYPTSLRIWKQQEEIGSLLEIWISRAQRGELLSSTKITPRHPVAGGVETWRKITTPRSPSAPSVSSTQPDQNNSPGVLLGSGTSARTEMLLERLPYLETILCKSDISAPSTASTLRDIQKITSFSTPNIPSDNAELDEDDGDEVRTGEQDQEQWATDAPTVTSPQKRRSKITVVKRAQGMESGESAVPGVGRERGLLLSDDDIED